MGRGGRSGGGSRSSGHSSHSSGRSSGTRIRSSSSSSHRGGYHSSSRSTSSHSSSGSSNRYYRSGHYYRRPAYISTGPAVGCRGIVASFIMICTVIVIVAILFSVIRSISFKTGGGGDITRSTIEREALPRGSVNETGYYTDELNWIKNPVRLEPGMKHFYEKTGVQPYLYITDSIDGEIYATVENMEAYAEKLYDELFTDEAHILLLFHEYDSNGEYSTTYLAGSQAKLVMDKEAGNILLDYIDSYYYSDLSEEELFSRAFEKTADRIMTVYHSPWPKVFGIFGIIILVIVVFICWCVAKSKKADEAKDTERILNMDLSKIKSDDDDKLKDLEEKYKS